MSESFVTVGADFGEAASPHLILITHSPRGGKSWLAARVLELVHAQERATGTSPQFRILAVDELAAIDHEAWEKLGSHQEATRNALQRAVTRLEASEAIPKALTGQEDRAREDARRAREASRRHAQQAVTRMRAHRR